MAALLTLGLGSGATFAVFSALDAVILDPLPYPESARLVAVSEGVDPDLDEPLSAADLAFWLRSEASGFEALVGYKYWLMTSGPSGSPEMLLALQVVGDFHAVVGIEPALGRSLTPEDQVMGAEPVVLVSHELWQRRLAGDAEAPGSRLLLGGEPYTVVGVMPRGFRFPLTEELPGQRVEVWVPLRMSAGQWADSLDHSFQVVARLAPGMSLDEARARTGAGARDPSGGETSASGVHPIALRSLREATVGHLRLVFAVLCGAVLCVFLVCCANLGNLMLARAAAGERKTAIKLAVGAKWRDLAGEWLVESLLLGLVGSVLGLAFAQMGIELFHRLDPVRLPSIDEIGVGLPALLLVIPVSVIAGGVGAVVAVLQMRRVDLQSSLKEGSHGAVGPGGRRRRRIRALLLFEIAAATVLAIAAGLLVRSYLELRSVDLGFEPNRVLTAWVLLPDARYPEAEDKARFFRDVFDRLEGEPGIELAGGVSNLPLTRSSWGTGLRVAGAAEARAGAALTAEFRVATPGYFEALDIPLVAGRRFEAGDRAGHPRVALADRALALRLSGDGTERSALGKMLSIDGAPGEPWRVVGVVGSTRGAEPATPVAPTIYLPHAQYPTPFLVMTVRTEGEPTAAVRGVRRALHSLDADQPMFNVRNMDALLATATAEERVRSFLLILLAALSVVLAVVGVYGTVANSVATRSQEFAVRLALGARPRGIVRLIMSSGIRLATLGIGLGLVAAAIVMRLLSGLLFGVDAEAPIIYVVVALVLEFAAAAACYPLALRARRVAPAAALAAS